MEIVVSPERNYMTTSHPGTEILLGMPPTGETLRHSEPEEMWKGPRQASRGDKT